MGMRFIANTQIFEERLSAMGDVKQGDIAKILTMRLGRKRDRSYVNLVKRGKRSVNTETALAFADVLSTDISKLFIPKEELTNETA